MFCVPCLATTPKTCARKRSRIVKKKHLIVCSVRWNIYAFFLDSLIMINPSLELVCYLLLVEKSANSKDLKLLFFQLVGDSSPSGQCFFFTRSASSVRISEMWLVNNLIQCKLICRPFKARTSYTLDRQSSMEFHSRAWRCSWQAADRD